MLIVLTYLGLLRWLIGKESTCPCRRFGTHRFDAWVRKIPWRKKWQPTPVFLPGESDRGAWKATVHGIAKGQTWLSMHAGTHWHICNHVYITFCNLHIHLVLSIKYEESWVPKNWCFWTVVLKKTLESPLDYKEIQPVHPKRDQSWVLFGRSDVKAETPILWPSDAKSWLIWKDPHAGKDRVQEEKGMTEDEIVGWHHWLNGHGFW